jgi:two-component system chemotaxis response regulator CheV
MSQANNILLDSNANELEIIEFYIEEELPDGTHYRGFYGMNVAKVLEIIRHPTVTGVPSHHHPAVLGTFNLRGRVLPLVDLAVWLNKKLASHDNLKVIVSEFSGIITSFLVSGVTRIHRMNWNQVEAPGSHVQTYSNQSITGVVRMDDRILFILDMEHIITSMDPTLDMSRRVEESGGEPPVDDAHQFRILIADDSTSMRNMIGATLERTGYQVTRTASGKEAWTVLTQWKQEAEAAKCPITDKVHLIISDIEMPEMDGHTLTRNIKQDPVLNKLPVVLFSSLITSALRSKGESVGADDQISKPDLPTLTHRVRTIISTKLGM